VCVCCAASREEQPSSIAQLARPDRSNQPCRTPRPVPQQPCRSPSSRSPDRSHARKSSPAPARPADRSQALAASASPIARPRRVRLPSCSPARLRADVRPRAFAQTPAPARLRPDASARAPSSRRSPARACPCLPCQRAASACPCRASAQPARVPAVPARSQRPALPSQLASSPKLVSSRRVSSPSRACCSIVV